MMGLQHVNGYRVVAEAIDKTSETGQVVVVCDRGTELTDRYVVWTVAQISGKTEAWQGFYTDNLYAALVKMARRATGYWLEGN